MAASTLLTRPAIPMSGIQVKVPADLLAALDQEAARHGATRSGLARNLIARGLEGLSVTT